MTLGLDEDAEGRVVAVGGRSGARRFRRDVIAVGPGLGRSPEVTAFVQALVERCGVPIVLDADGAAGVSPASPIGSSDATAST